MDTIDQRILIPTSPDRVWEYISNIDNNPRWQAGCRRVAFLTSVKTGGGTRWRCETDRGSDFVVEVTAWYERMGYEYTIVDGLTFKQNQGRLRLQEVAEGTVIQWTFSYDPGGLLGGLRNSISTRRNFENMIIESLWSLWRQITQQRTERPADFTAKSLMQDAPDVEARSQYKPRHPSVLTQQKPELQGATISEPPISDEDTRPRSAVQTAEHDTTGEEQPPAREPDFLEDVQESPKAPDFPGTVEASQAERPTEEAVQSQPQPETSTEPEPAESLLDDTAKSPPAAAPERPKKGVEMPPELTEEDEEILDRVWDSIRKEKEEDEGGGEVEEEVDRASSPVPPQPAPLADSQDTDPAKMSVFELFGVPRPSDTGEPAPPAASPSSEPPPPVKSEPEEVILEQDAPPLRERRIGLRLRLRRSQVKLRQPR
jgi:hypothetical protein